MAKYWEIEKPVVLMTEKNEIRVFTENGKIQVYPKVPSAPNGVGKGATIDLEAMSIEELQSFGVAVGAAIGAARAKQTSTDPSF